MRNFIEDIKNNSEQSKETALRLFREAKSIINIEDYKVREAYQSDLFNKYFELIIQELILTSGVENTHEINNFKIIHDIAFAWELPDLTPEEIGIIGSAQGYLMNVRPAVLEKLLRIRDETTFEEHRAADILVKLREESAHYREHLARKIEKKVKKLPKEFSGSHKGLERDALVNKVVEEYDSAALYADGGKSPLIKKGSTLDKTIEKYKKILDLEESLETEGSAKEKITVFKLKFDEHKDDLCQKTQRGASFVKKIGAILSYAAVVGFAYKRLTKSPTFFGQSHGAATANKFDKIISATPAF